MIGRRSLMATAAAAAFPWHALGAETEGSLVFGGYGGTLEQVERDNIIPAFQKATGIKVELVVGTALSNYAKVVASRNRPDMDVYWSNELTHAAGKQQGLYDKLDPAVVTNLPDVLDIGRDPDNIGVASCLMGTGIEYNSKALADAGIPAPKSWKDLWDPRLKGRVAMYTFDVAYSQDILAIFTRLAGGTEKDIRPGIAQVKQLRTNGNLAMFAATPAELDNMLVQAQAWVTVNGSPRAFILKQNGAPIDFSYPTEGAGFFTNYFCPIKGAPHPKAAQVFINFMLSPEAQAILSKSTVTAPINRKVPIPAGMEAAVPHDAADIAKMIRIDRVQMNQDLDSWADMWNHEIQGRR